MNKISTIFLVFIYIICESTQKVTSDETIHHVNKRNIEEMVNNFHSEINVMTVKASQSRVDMINDLVDRANMVRNSIGSLMNSMYNNVNTAQNNGLSKINNDVRLNLTDWTNELRAAMNRQYNECQNYLKQTRSQYFTDAWNVLQHRYNQIMNQIDQVHQQKAKTIDEIQNKWIKNVDSLRSNINLNSNEMYKIITIHSDWISETLNRWESKNAGNIDEIKRRLTDTQSALVQHSAGGYDHVPVESYNEWIDEMNRLIKKSEADVKQALDSLNAFFSLKIADDKERNNLWHSYHLEDVYLFNQQLQKSVSELTSLIKEEVDLINLELTKLCTNL